MQDKVAPSIRKWCTAGCLGLVGMLLAAGCSRKTSSFEEQVKLARSVNQQNLDFQMLTERKLAEVADSVDRSLAELAAIERTRTPSAKKLVVVNSAELEGKRVTLDWNGPVAPLLQRVAKLVGYSLRVLGKAPAVPVLISVSGHDMPVVDLLRGVDLQCGQRARVAVYSKQKVIELRYHE